MILRVALAVVLTLLGACGGLSPREAADGTPPPVSAAAVPDAVPRPDPILAAGNKSPYSVNGVTYRVLDSASGYREEGRASWYGTKFDGRKTSNGEIFDVYAPTAAHKTLPLPSYVRVTNLDNGRSMVLRVNDRGPFHGGRIIDLSYGAAVKLGYADQGTARVRVEAIEVAGVDDRRGNAEGVYRNLQLGAFSSEVSARELENAAGPVVAAPLSISRVDTAHGRLYRLRAGPFATERALRDAQRALSRAGLPPGQPLP